MFAPSRPRYCDMFTPQIGLLRHVPVQPTPLLRHVHPADRATATCSRPADPATATCSPGRPGYCDMFAPSRPPLLRHVHPADPATATCPSRGQLVRNGVSGQRRRAVTGGNLQLDFSTSPPRRGKHGGQFPSEQVGGDIALPVPAHQGEVPDAERRPHPADAHGPTALNSPWWNPGERRERGGARLTRRVREEYRVYFDRNATPSAAKRQFSRWGGGSGGMHRRSNAAWVSPQAVKGRPIVGGGAAAYPDAAAATVKQSPPPRGAGLVA